MSDSFKDSLVEANENKEEAHLIFLTKYKKKSNIIFAFVEGKTDPCFYRKKIEDLLHDNWELEIIPAGNKSKVLNIHDTLDWRVYPKKRIGFFVDQDLDLIPPIRQKIDTNIFTTDNYSIENYFINWKIIKEVLIDFYSFHKLTSAEWTQIRNLYEQAIKDFYTFNISIMARILDWRKTESRRVNLSGLKLKDLISINNGVVNIRIAHAQLDDFLHDKCKADKLTKNNISQNIIFFNKKTNQQKYTRGKFLTWFIITFCNSIHSSCISIIPSVVSQPKCQTQINEPNFIAIMGTRIKTPHSLSQFIKENYLSYIRLEHSSNI